MGSAEAVFDGLYRKHYRDVYGYCLRRVSRERVEDAVAEVFTVAWRRRGVVPGGADSLLWLYGVARRVVAHEWRSVARRSRLVRRAGAAAGESAWAGPELQLVERAEYRMIRQAAAQLRPEEREILMLTVWEELSQAEVGEVLGISRGAVKQRLHRARRKLARAYAALDASDDGDQPPATAQEGGGR